MYGAFFCVFTMYSTGWAKSRRALDRFFTIMAEISGRYWLSKFRAGLDRSGEKIILLSSLLASCYGTAKKRKTGEQKTWAGHR